MKGDKNRLNLMSLFSKQELLRVALVPMFLLVLFIVFILFYKSLGLPKKDEIIATAQQLFDTHGYWVVFIAAFLEGMLLLGWYLPGSVVIVFGVIASRNGPLNPILVVTSIVFAFFATAITNYGLGRYGWYRLFLHFGLGPPLERIKKRTKEKGLHMIWPTYFHPNLGTLTATSCGILQLPFRKFVLYSLIALIAWNTLWGVLVYFMGNLALRFLNMWLVVLVLFIWLVIRLFKQIQFNSRRALYDHEAEHK